MKLTRFHSKARRAERREQAMARHTARGRRTAEEQIILLRSRPGEATRETTRLDAEREAEQAKAEAKAKVERKRKAKAADKRKRS